MQHLLDERAFFKFDSSTPATIIRTHYDEAVGEPCYSSVHIAPEEEDSIRSFDSLSTGKRNRQMFSHTTANSGFDLFLIYTRSTRIFAGLIFIH